LQRLPVAGIGLGEVRLEYSYRGQIFFDFKNDPLFSAPAVSSVNFSARLDSRDGRWYAYLAARNLTDKRWIEGVSATPGGAGLLYWTVVNQARSVQVGAGTRF
jgi:outer membrane receptor protein involved in Fe transport